MTGFYDTNRSSRNIENHSVSFHPVVIARGSYTVLDLSKGYFPDHISLNPPSIGRYDEQRKDMYVSALYVDGRDVHVGLDFWVPEETIVYSFDDGDLRHIQHNNNDGDYGPTLVFRYQGEPIRFLLARHFFSWLKACFFQWQQPFSRERLIQSLHKGKTRLGSFFSPGEMDRVVHMANFAAMASAKPGGASLDDLASEMPDALYVLMGHLSESSLQLREPNTSVLKGEPVGRVGSRAENGGWAPHLHLQLSIAEPVGGNLPGVVHKSDRTASLLLFPDPTLITGSVWNV